MNLSTSALSSPNTNMRKRPRTSVPFFDMACTSALTSVPSNENTVTATQFFVTPERVDKALAELDVGLGLGCAATPSLPVVSSVGDGCKSIEEELEAVLNQVRKEQAPTTTKCDASDDTSCVSGSGSLGRGTVVKVEDSSESVDVLRELQSLDSRASTSVMSPPLLRTIVKRRFR